MRRLAAWFRRAAVAFAVALVLVWLSLAPGDPALYPPKGDERVHITVLDHGWHTGLALARGELQGAAVRLAAGAPEAAERLHWLATRYPDDDWIEIGWGDAAFYRSTPDVADMDAWLSFRALAWPTPSVIQVVPGRGPVAEAFPTSALVGLDLSRQGFDRLAAALAANCPRPAGDRRWRPASTAGARSFRPCCHTICSGPAMSGPRGCCARRGCRRARSSLFTAAV